MALLRLEGLWKRYGFVEAVKNLNLACEDGQLLALLGPSGCGKTTTLKMIAGIEQVTQGEIYFDDRPVTNLAPGRRNIGMVFEDYALYPHLSVAENIAFPLKIRKLPSTEIETKVKNATHLLGMSKMLDEEVRHLSGGAQQRVAIGRAIVRDPELLLFDEPLSHLDGDHKVLLRGEIKRLQKTKGLTSILVTHDQTEAIAMADRVAVMEEGVLKQVGEPQELYDYPADLFVASFIGEPPMNLLPGTLLENGGRFFLEGRGWRIPLGPNFFTWAQGLGTSSSVVLGVRPEHVRLVPRGTGTAEGDDSLVGQVFFREPRGDVDVILVRLTGRSGQEYTEGAAPQNMLIVEASGDISFQADEPVEIRFMENRLHVFNAETQVNLNQPKPAT
jgi:ABC-type sugar transport system ATPase subunit